MSLADARKIYDGLDDAATRYFQSKMTSPLSGQWEPLVAQSLDDVGAIGAYEGRSESMPSYLLCGMRANLTQYVIEKGLDGLFH
jgi:hypothetical protein